MCVLVFLNLIEQIYVNLLQTWISSIASLHTVYSLEKAHTILHTLRTLAITFVSSERLCCVWYSSIWTLHWSFNFPLDFKLMNIVVFDTGLFWFWFLDCGFGFVIKHLAISVTHIFSVESIQSVLVDWNGEYPDVTSQYQKVFWVDFCPRLCIMSWLTQLKEQRKDVSHTH